MVQGEPIKLTMNDTQAEEFRQSVIQAAPQEQRPLLEGLGSGLFKTLAEIFLAQAVEWIKNPANLQMLINLLIGMVTKKTTP